MTSAGEVSYAEAIRYAQQDAMAEDETIVLLGQDISSGFPFGATAGLAELYGAERVRDTPISEAATMGCAIGAAMAGARTVVEVDFAGFLLLGVDQLLNNAAKLRYMSGGQLRVPLVVRVGQGPLGAFAAQHSQSQHGWLASVPGLALCAPASVQDAYDLLRWALRQRDPVVIAEDMRLYRTRGVLERTGSGLALDATAPDISRSTGEPRVTGEPVPSARVVRAGADVSVLCFGFGVTLAQAAAQELAREGIELEILDLRMLSPLDERAIAQSARHTSRVLCLGDDPLLGGITATHAAITAEQADGALAAPVARLGARAIPTPFGDGEAFVYPSAESLATAVRRLRAWPAEPDVGGPIVHGELRIGQPAGAEGS